MDSSSMQIRGDPDEILVVLKCTTMVVIERTPDGRQ